MVSTMPWWLPCMHWDCVEPGDECSSDHILSERPTREETSLICIFSAVIVVKISIYVEALEIAEVFHWKLPKFLTSTNSNWNIDIKENPHKAALCHLLNKERLWLWKSLKIFVYCLLYVGEVRNFLFRQSCRSINTVDLNNSKAPDEYLPFMHTDIHIKFYFKIHFTFLYSLLTNS